MKLIFYLFIKNIQKLQFEECFIIKYEIISMKNELEFFFYSSN